MNEKKRKVVLLTKNNYKESILEVLRNTQYEFLIILYFDCEARSFYLAL